ncbi:MAG: glycerol-3-phosphate acyltransferase [Chloroflexi bacterium]|nr:MAG: glycerol-3-phosphate acyltransferase [Chloroflexota bacterium]
MTLAVVLVASYLLGSIPTSYLVVYPLTGRDIRTMGSGNPGTMNVLDTLGWGAAFVVGLVDVGKGAAAVALARLSGLSEVEAIMAALCAVAGHDWSIFLRLDGGNGTAAGVGALLALLPSETLVATAVGVAVAYLMGSRRIGGIVGLLLLPTMAFWWHAPEVRTIGAMVLITFTVLKIIRFEGFTPARTRR